MMPYNAIKEVVFEGCKFSYESYDHKKAMEEIEMIKATGGNVPYLAKNYFELMNSCYGVPDSIKKNHIVWRTGKLRQIYFDKNGQMCRFKIGQRWYKNFYLKDFGVSVKPMIFKSADHWNLIGQGMAIEETI